MQQHMSEAAPQIHPVCCAYRFFTCSHVRKHILEACIGDCKMLASLCTQLVYFNLVGCQRSWAAFKKAGSAGSVALLQSFLDNDLHLARQDVRFMCPPDRILPKIISACESLRASGCS